MKLSSQEIERFEQWIKENVTEEIVPDDEGNGNALIYNLIHLLRGDSDRYHYAPEQDDEISSWGL